MSIVNGYATLAEFKVRIDPSSALGTGSDSVLEAVIEAASRAIDYVCGRRIYTATETRTYTAEYGDLLFIDDLVSLTTLKTDESGDGTYELTWSSTDYLLEPANAQVPAANKEPYTQIRVNPHRGIYSFPTGIYNGVQIAGSFGYAATTPDLVNEACLLIASRFNRRKDAPFGVVGAGELGQMMVIASKDPDVQLCLSGYKRRYVVAV